MKFDIQEVSKLFVLFIGRERVHTLKEDSSVDYADNETVGTKRTWMHRKTNATQIGAMVLLKYPHPFSLEDQDQNMWHTWPTCLVFSLLVGTSCVQQNSWH